MYLKNKYGMKYVIKTKLKNHLSEKHWFKQLITRSLRIPPKSGAVSHCNINYKDNNVQVFLNVVARLSKDNSKVVHKAKNYVIPK